MSIFAGARRSAVGAKAGGCTPARLPSARSSTPGRRPPMSAPKIGHWESDSLLFGRVQAVNVLVDRLSRFTVLTRLAGKTARDTRHVLVERLDRLPRRSLTADNGAECADHGSISQELAIPFFFCHPYHSWEKGTVENANGLIRPASISGAVQMRLARLPAEATDTLRVAAIVGRVFQVGLLASLLDFSEEVAEDLLRPALQAGLLRSLTAGEFTFSHDKIREVLYNEVSSSRRQRLHEHIGDALEAPGLPLRTQRLSDLAFHFARSTDRDRGARYSLETGLSAMETYAGEEARLHFRAALSLLPPDDAGRGGVLVGLGEACLLAGDEVDAICWFREP